MTPIHTKRPRITASHAHTYGDRTSTNGKIDTSQRLLIEQESTSAYNSLRVLFQQGYGPHAAVFDQFVEWVWLAWPLSYGHPSITAKLPGPDGGRYRGVPLYTNKCIMCMTTALLSIMHNDV